MQAGTVLDRNEVIILGIVHLGLAMGVAIFGGVVLALNQGAGGQVAAIPESLRVLTWFSASLPFAALAISRPLFHRLLAEAFARLARGGSGTSLKGGVRSAYIVKAALMEAPALLGLITLLMIVLLPCDLWRAPAFYRLNFVGPALFLLETALTFPTPGRFDFAVRSLAPGDGRRPR